MFSVIVLNLLNVLVDFFLCYSCNKRAALCKVWSGCSGWGPQAARTYSQITFCTELRHGWVQTHSPQLNFAVVWMNEDN